MNIKSRYANNFSFGKIPFYNENIYNIELENMYFIIKEMIY